MTIPSIPDNYYKLLSLIGALLLTYAYIESIENNNKLYKTQIEYNSSIDSLNMRIKKVEHEKKKLIRKSELLSSRYGIKNPIGTTVNDSFVTFQQTVIGPKYEISINDSLARNWDYFKDLNFDVSMYSESILNNKRILDSEQESHDSFDNLYMCMAFLGMILLLTGLSGMARYDELQSKILKSQIIENPYDYNYCQSCVKSFTIMRKKGTNSDSTINNAFCIQCYENGQFTEPNLTYDEMAKRIKLDINKTKGYFQRLKIKKRFIDAARWNSNEYI